MGKNKLAHFEEMKEFANVVQPPNFGEVHPLKGRWASEFFGNSNPIVLELGCGKGEYTLALARRNPNVNYIGVDVKGARIWRGAKTAVEEQMDNVGFLRTKIDFIDHFFDKDEVAELWMTFSDPQPKKPRKRLTSPLFIARYRKFLREGGAINMKIDSELLFDYTIEQIEANGYVIEERSNDIYNGYLDQLDEGWRGLLNEKTYYEAKWLKEGRAIKFLRFTLT